LAPCHGKILLAALGKIHYILVSPVKNPSNNTHGHVQHVLLSSLPYFCATFKIICAPKI